MSGTIPRLRMFAGPNGSGKTTVKNGLPSYLFNVYINPDEIEKSIRKTGELSLAEYGVSTETEELRRFLRSSKFLVDQNLAGGAANIVSKDGVIDCRTLAMNSYYASVLADFLRGKLLAASRSFTFETVMSSADKVDLLRRAKQAGFKNYLYFVATKDPVINVSRVKNRFAQGGHDVPENKIIERYTRCMKLLRAAIPLTDRAYFFNSSIDFGAGESPRDFAEITNGVQLELKADEIPSWFKTWVLDTLFHDFPS